jgi:Ca2+-binding EF-hand superfamily protein
VSEVEIEAMMDVANQNSDGCVEYEEFFRIFMHAHCHDILQ